MPPKVAELLAIQEDAGHVRNICILAHVDHGKTSLTDSLIASNGIISARQAGKLRYMDSRDDEQDRGITMKSSAIALIFEGRELINIVDSPGHVDFGPEVSTAIRLSDGAVVVIDAVEGVCVQTHTVLQQVWREGLTPVLFINKLDRLVFELQLGPEEAHAHLQRIVRQVNDIFGALNSVAHYRRAGTEGEDAEEADFEFRPEDGTVVFGSALHGWAFTVGTFAELMAPKLGVTLDELRFKMWSDFFWSPKAAAFTADSNGGRLKPLFAQLALSNIWRAHEAANDETAEGPFKLAKIISALGLIVSSHELKSSDPSSRVRAVLSAWLPLAPTLLGAVAKHVPAARSAQPRRLDRIWPTLLTPGNESCEAAVRAAAHQCDGASEHVLVHVSKMFVNGQGEAAVGFARVYAGTLRKGQRLYVLGGGANTRRGGVGGVVGVDGGMGGGEGRLREGEGALSVDREVPEGTVMPYLMMGRDLLAVETVPAGSLCALGGLGGLVIKGGTLCSEPNLPPFRPIWDATGTGAPIVRVAIEALRPADMAALQAGLRQLNQADPSVEVSHLDSGELVLGTCGEVHLERCLRDLKDDFARVEFKVSPPLIPFRESVATGSVGAAETRTADRRYKLRVVARPLSAGAVAWLSARARLCPSVEDDGAEAAARAAEAMLADGDGEELGEGAAGALERLLRGESPLLSLGSSESCPKGACEDADMAELGASAGCVAVGLGPAVHPTCVLFASKPIASALAAARAGGVTAADEAGGSDVAALLICFAPAIVAGFQAAAGSGPLCEEPMAGLAFSIEAIEAVCEGGEGGEGDAALRLVADEDSVARCGPLGVQLMAASRDACRQAYLASAPRLVEAVYACGLQCTQEVMGRMYGVLSKRRARVTREEMIEGTPLFVVHAFLPVVESIGFAGEIRKMTSGAAHPQLVFSHWQRLEVDPLEQLLLSTIDDDEFNRDSSKNIARAYVRAVRLRKGLLVEDKLVEVATKQRTRARKK